MNLVKTAKVLVELVNADQGKRKAFIKEIEHLEHQRDNITHMIFNEQSIVILTKYVKKS